MEEQIIISPEGKNISAAAMEAIFDGAGASFETVFRRLEINRVIRYTGGAGIDIGCGLNKVHSAAIGIDFRLGDMDFGYPFGANILCPKNKEYMPLTWFTDASLDFVFSSHCLEHFTDPRKAVREMLRVLKTGGCLVLILPDMRYYPVKGAAAANEDHEWDSYPDALLEIVRDAGGCETVQFDTLHGALEDVKLTERDSRIAEHYGHETLNFSFEGVFRKR